MHHRVHLLLRFFPRLGDGFVDGTVAAPYSDLAGIPADVAKSYGLSGANLRASGVDWDLRRDQSLPMAWDKADWKVWTHPDGDSFARCWIRLQETRESCKIVEQLLDQIPAGPIMTKVPRIIKVPEGEAWVSTENPLGEMGYYVVSKGDLVPFRVKIRSASFNNITYGKFPVFLRIIN